MSALPPCGRDHGSVRFRRTRAERYHTSVFASKAHSGGGRASPGSSQPRWHRATGLAKRDPCARGTSLSAVASGAVTALVCPETPVPPNSPASRGRRALRHGSAAAAPQRDRRSGAVPPRSVPARPLCPGPSRPSRPCARRYRTGRRPGKRAGGQSWRAGTHLAGTCSKTTHFPAPSRPVEVPSNASAAVDCH